MADATGKGLEGVVAAQTRISDVDGRQGRLFYAGYDIADLAAHATFEETVHLLHHLELPTAAELSETVATLRAESVLEPLLVELIGPLAQRTGPMTTLRTAVSAAAALDPDDGSPEANLRTAYRLIAKTPQIIATYQRLRTGADAVEPRDDLGVAANFLYALTGKQPDPQTARDFDVVLVLYADHTLNASTFAGRVAAATLADMYAAATAAVATLQGPLHGGAIQEVREMLEEIGTPDRAPDWVRERLAARQKITWDPRATVLREIAERLGKQFGETRWYDTSVRVQETVMAEKTLYPNVDFYTASVYSALQLPPDLYTPLFAASRMAGWTAHIREQYADNRLIRPDSEYIGPEPRQWRPIERRK